MKTLPRNVILPGDARAVLPTLLPESLDCAVLSPPYANGLRRYSDSADELGQEPTVTAYIENIREVMRGVRRLLKDSGSAFVVIADSYATHSRQGVPRGSLLLAPQRLALALSADGWWVRNVGCWAKPNPLPQSAPDRFSPIWEAVLFVTKTRRYFFDLDSVRVPHRSADRAGRPRRAEVGRKYQGNNTGLGKLKAAGRVGAVA
ncbi:MAG: DNA-methyltransferase, partial [Solirubrobacterales bacterium]